MALDLAEPATVAALVALVGFAVYWWLKWQTRVAWFHRGLADARSRAHEESRDDGRPDDEH